MDSGGVDGLSREGWKPRMKCWPIWRRVDSGSMVVAREEDVAGGGGGEREG